MKMSNHESVNTKNIPVHDSNVGSGSTVLIVDDEARVRKTLRMLLMAQNYNLALASNGEEALAKAAELIPDLILLDVMMPGMDGIEVCRRLRADPQLAEVPIIIITALDDRDSRLQAIEAGADDFISKPFDRIELRARVQAITRLNRYRRLLMERTYRQEAEEEILRRNRDLTLLNQVITATATTLNVADILHIACETLAQVTQLSQATGLLFDSDRTLFDLEIHYTVPDLQFDKAQGLTHNNLNETIPLVSHLAVEDLLTFKLPLLLTDGHLDARLLARAYSLLAEYGVESLLIVPILIRNEVVGFIELGMIELRQFDDQDMTLMQSIATAIGQALETAQLYQSLQHYADGLEETVALRTHELQTERDHTEAILDASGEAIIVTDMEGIIQYANPAALTMTGFNQEVILGQRWGVWQNEPLSPEFFTQLQGKIRHGQTWRGETLNKRSDGTLYDAALTVAPLFDPDERDHPVGFVTVQRNITLLKELDRLKNQFISNASHELRTPLSVITFLSGNLDTLYDRLDTPKRQKMIKDIRKHAGILTDLVNGVLEISHLDDGRHSLEYQEIDLVQLVNEEINYQHPLAQEKDHHLQLIGLESLNIKGDLKRLQLVLRNLLNNAIKYSPKGGHITCECQLVSTQEKLEETAWPEYHSLPPGFWAAVRIVDNGIGISPEDLPHIFGRFYRVRQDENVPGSGLGLSIAAESIELHNGYLAASSLPGQETVFAIYLPIIEEKIEWKP